MDTTPPSEYEPVLDRFETAWADGPEPPVISDYLPEPGSPARLAVLLELIRVDLDHRQARQESAGVDPYLERFPELRDRPAAVESLRRFAADRARAPTPTGPGAGAEILAPGTRVGRYELRGLLGRGGMGVVYRARDRDLDRDVALKLSQGRYAGDVSGAGRFRAEARITARLPHPGVPSVYELGALGDGSPFLAMKVIEGRTLAALLAERPDPGHDLPRFLGRFEQVCQAVGFAHAQGIVHRDLKPSNVMVGAFGEVQVLDWGLARDLRRPDGSEDSRDPRPADETAALPAPFERTGTGSVLGTPAYMAPEQARGEPATPRADVFALGAVLFEILTGASPHGADLRELSLPRIAAGPTNEALARLAASGADAEPAGMAKRCLATDPGDRFADAAQLADALATYRAGVEERARRAELERAAAEAKVAEGRKRRRWQLTVAAAALVIVTGGGAFGWWQDRQASARREREGRNRDALVAAVGRCEGALRAGDARAAAAALDDVTDRAAGGGAEDVRERAERCQAELAVLEELDRVDNLRWSPAKNRAQLRTAVSGHWKSAFAGFGIDLGRTPPETAAARIKGSLIRERLLAALDLWLVFSASTEIASLLRASDPDAYRDSVRTAVCQSDEGELRRLLLRPAGRTQPARFVVALGGNSPVHPDRVRAALERAVVAEPDNLHVLMGLAMTYDSDQPGEAAKKVRWYQAAVAAHPRNVIAWNDLGTALQRSGDVDGAVACYEKVIELDPPHGLARTNLGGVRYRKGDVDGAIALWREAIGVDPGQVEAHINLGGVLGLKGFKEESLAHLRAAVTADPQHVEARLNLGHELGRRGSLDEAISCYRAASELNPKDGRPYYGLGLCYRLKNDPRRAIDSYRTAVRFNPKDAASHNSLGALLVGEGDLAGAVAAFREAGRLDPKNLAYKKNLEGALVRQAESAVELAPAPRPGGR